MRWMPLFLLALCLPLSAGDADVLNAAVKSFESESGAVRQNASKAVRRYLEQELAPLIKAMKSEDPEVARRARDALAAQPEYQQDKPEQPARVVAREDTAR